MNQREMFNPAETLFEARQRLEAARWGKKGAVCPCCDQSAVVYRRAITADMARGLIWLYRAGGHRRFVHVNREAPAETVRNGGHLALSAKWGLIEAPPPDAEYKRTSGLWRLTALGVEFVTKHRAIPSHAYVYNNEVVRWSPERITIGEALGSKYSYAELIGGEACSMSSSGSSR